MKTDSEKITVKNTQHSEDVLLSIDRDPLFGMNRDEFVDKLKRALWGRVDEAYFFGSFTSDRFGKTSDIDIILIKKDCGVFHTRAFEFEDLLNLIPSTDILVYTKEEFTALTDESAQGFWKSVRNSLVRFL